MVSIGYTYFLVLQAPSGSWEGKQELAALEVNMNVKPRPVPHRLVTLGLRLKPLDLWQGNKTNYTAGLLWTSDNMCKASGHRRGRAMGFQYTSIDPLPFDIIILRTHNLHTCSHVATLACLHALGKMEQWVKCRILESDSTVWISPPLLPGHLPLGKLLKLQVGPCERGWWNHSPLALWGSSDPLWTL